MESGGIGILASTRVPPDLWLPTLDLFAAVSGSGTPLIGGFHSPLERHVYEVALTAGGKVVRLSAVPDAGAAPSKLERSALEEGRLLLLYPDGGDRRLTARATGIRTQRVLWLSNRIFIPAAQPRSRTYHAAAQAVATGIPTFCFDHPRNTDLQILGVVSVDPWKGSPAAGAAVLGP